MLDKSILKVLQLFWSSSFTSKVLSYSVRYNFLNIL
jgi:hypothetical protein